MITGRQIKAARALLGWDAADLAKYAKLSRETISNIENSLVQAREATLHDIAQVFDAHRIEFIENQGVRFKSNDIEVYEGIDRFNDFFDFIYAHLKQFGGEVCIGNSDPLLYAKYHKGFETHKKRMEELVGQKSVSFRILVKEGDRNFTASSYAQYRWQPEKSFVPTSFYAFGECLALITFTHNPPPYVILIKSGPLAEAYRQAFDLAWDQAIPPMSTKKGS